MWRIRQCVGDPAVNSGSAKKYSLRLEMGFLPPTAVDQSVGSEMATASRELYKDSSYWWYIDGNDREKLKFYCDLSTPRECRNGVATSDG